MVSAPRRAATAVPVVIPLVVIPLLLCGACAPALPQEPAAAEKPLVYVSILPQQYLVQRLCPDRLEVAVLVGPGRSPATYEPTPKQMAGLQRADLFIRIGVPFEENLLHKVSELMPSLPIIDGRRGIELQPMAAHTHTDESAPHDHADHHDHPDHGDHADATQHHHEPGQPDPHFWLDPLLVIRHVTTVADALAEHFAADPALVADLGSSREALIADLQAVHDRMAVRLAPLAGRQLFVYHPAFGYLARRHGLEQVPVQCEGKEPSARQLGGLIEQAGQEGATAIFVQPQMGERSARVVAEAAGTQVVTLDPLAPDYLDNLERMAERIAGALSP